MKPSLQQMETAYRACGDLRSAANRLAISRETLRKGLKNSGIATRRGRPGGLSAEGVGQAKSLYLDDRLSTHAIASRLGVGQETVRAALIYAGVTLRSPSLAISIGMRRSEADGA